VIAVVDERHVARGYDPYNSADQPHIISARNLKRDMDRAALGLAPRLTQAQLVKMAKGLIGGEYDGLNPFFAPPHPGNSNGI